MSLGSTQQSNGSGRTRTISAGTWGAASRLISLLLPSDPDHKCHITALSNSGSYHPNGSSTPVLTQPANPTIPPPAPTSNTTPLPPQTHNHQPPLPLHPPHPQLPLIKPLPPFPLTRNQQRPPQLPLHPLQHLPHAPNQPLPQPLPLVRRQHVHVR